MTIVLVLGRLCWNLLPTTKKKTKNIAILAILLTLVCVACREPIRQKANYKSIGESQFIQPSSDSRGSLLVWFSLDSSYLPEIQLEKYRQSLTGIVESFQKAYPEVNINVEFIENDKIVDKYLYEIDHGFGPDIVLTKNLHLGHLFNNNALDAINLNNFSIDYLRKDALEQGKYAGKYYAIPVVLGTQVLCYNKQKVKEIPKTIEDLVRISREGHSVGITSNFGDTLWGLGIFDGQLFDDRGKVILDSGPWSEWMKFLDSIKSEPNIILIPSSIAADQALIEGKVAYSTCWALAIPQIITSLGRDNLGVAILPGRGDRHSSPPLTGFSFILNPASNDNQRNLALKLAQFFTNVEQQQKLVMQSGSAIPVNTQVVLDARLLSIRSTLQKQSLTAKSYDLNQIEKIEFMLDIGDRFYDSVLSGAITPEEAATEITKLTNEQFSPLEEK